MSERTQSATDGAVSSGAFSSSRVQFAAQKLSALIDEAKPGDRLGKKDEIRKTVGVSLGTFNEALRLLQSQGSILLKPGPNGGLFAAHQSPMARFGSAILQLDADAASVGEAIRIRTALESLIVEDAILSASPLDITQMRVHLGEMWDAVNNNLGLNFLRANWHLHATIASVSRNTMLKSMYTNLLDLIEGHTISVMTVEPVPMQEFHRDRYEVHRNLVEAIASGDREAALCYVEVHNAGMFAGPASHSDPSE